METHGFTHGPFSLDRSGLVLLRDGKAVEVGQRGIALLKALVQASGQVVTKAELIDSVWSDVVVEEGNLAVQVAALRKVLGKRADGRDWIETVPRVGYRLVASEAGQPSATVAMPSLAVLPFENLGGDPEQEYFADGMVDDITTALSRFHSFAVVARNSAFTYKGRALDVRQVARELGVRYVLEGSVRTAGDRMRVTAQLADGETGLQLWANKFDGERKDVFEVQDRITESVIGLIEPQIRRAEIERVRRKRPENLDAYDLYWQGLAKIQGPEAIPAEGYGDCIALFERAIDLDPGFAPALAYAALAHEKRLTRGGTAPPGVDDSQAAITLAQRALAADGEDAVVLAIAGLVLVTVAGEADRGMVFLRRALAFNPNSLLVANLAGYCHFYRADFGASVLCYERALQLSPVLPDTLWSINGIARAHLSAGRIDEALAWCERSLNTSSEYEWPHCMSAACLEQLGRHGEATSRVAIVRSMWPTLTVKELLGQSGEPEGRDRFLAEGLVAAGLPRA